MKLNNICDVEEYPIVLINIYIQYLSISLPATVSHPVPIEGGSMRGLQLSDIITTGKKVKDFRKVRKCYSVSAVRGLVNICLQTSLILTPCVFAFAGEQPIEQYLEMDLSQLMEVTITSVSKKEQTLADTAAAVYVISQEDIRRSGVTTVPEALALAPGVHVAQITSSRWSVSSRGFAGFTSNKLLILIDGRSVYSPAFSGTFWDMQHTLLEDIDRIEVIRGPGGTIWGANAVNGVINIITQNSEDIEGSLVRVGAGSHEQLTAAARVWGKLGENSAGRFYITGNDRDSLELSGSGDDAGDGWQNIQAGFRVDGKSGSRLDWTIQGDAFQNTGDQSIFPYWISSPPYVTTNETDLDNNGANLLTSLAYDLKNDQKISAQLYYDYNDRDEDPYNFKFNTLDLNLQYEAQVASVHQFTIGTGYRNVDASFEQNYQFSLPDGSYDLFSAFLQDEISLVKDRLIATFGIKWENNDFTGAEWQPSAKLLWKPKENHSLWTSVARAVRTPSIVEDSGQLLFATFPTSYGTGTVYLVGNEQFESEELYAYEAGYRWQASSALSADIALFYNDYDSLYTLNPIGVTSTNQTFGNDGEASSYGVELAIKWRPESWLSFDFTYSYLDFQVDRVSSAAGRVVNTSYTSTTPKHQIGVRNSIDLSEKWQINSWLRYQDSTESRNSAVLPGDTIKVDDFYVLDVNVIWRPRPGLEVMLAGQNLLESNQLQYVAEAYVPPTEVARGVYAKITWSF
jgi:iron complex outermembrane receptor protein